MNASNEGRDLNLTDIEARLRALNPGYTGLRVEAPRGAGAAVRVLIETTRAEMQATGGKLRLTDPELEGLRLETTLRFLDQKPNERIRVNLSRDTGSAGPGRKPRPTKPKARKG
jgi:hypothetical protein